MAGFLYHPVGVRSNPTLKHIDDWGMRYAFARPAPPLRDCSAGPSKRAGGVMADPEQHDGKQIGYFPDEQTWRKMPTVGGRPELWIGYWNDAKPRPNDLARRKMLPGGMVRFTDGNEWQIPIVRKYDDAAQAWQSLLPTYLDYDDEGRIIKGRPIEEHAALWELTEPLAELRFAAALGEENDAFGERVYAAVIGLLRANYLVDLPELAMLGVLSEDASIASAIAVATRYDDLIAWLHSQKKTSADQDGSNSSAGEAA